MLTTHRIDINRLVAVVAATIALGTLTAYVMCFWSFTVDDAFIIFRYANNLAAGSGLTYNPGQQHAEGYTTFLWTIILALPHLFQADPVLFSKIAGLTTTLLNLFATLLFAARLTSFMGLKHHFIPPALALLYLVSFPATSVHAVSGMETALFTFLYTFFLFTISAPRKTPGRKTMLGATLAALALGLTRPEGNLCAAIGLAAALFNTAPGRRTKFALFILLGYMLPGALYFSWRFHYYGHFMPLPFYVKIGTHSQVQGIRIVGAFAREAVLPVAFLIVLGLYNCSRALAPAAAAVIAHIFFYLFPNHLMGFGWRFLFPVIPCLFVFAAVGAGTFLHFLQHQKSRLYTSVLAGVLFVLCVLPIVKFIFDGMNSLQQGAAYSIQLKQAHIPLGKYLRQFDQGRQHVLAVADAGAIPYYSQWQAVDLFGLNDAHIAMAGTPEPNYVLTRNPDLVILVSLQRAVFQPGTPWGLRLFTSCIKHGMTPVGIVAASLNYYLWLMAKPNSEIAAYIAKR